MLRCLSVLAAASIAQPAFGRPVVVAPDAPAPTLIEDVSVFDGETGTIDGPYDVVLQDGRIVSIRPAEPGALPLGDGWERIGGQGNVLVAGFVDLHVHVQGRMTTPSRLPLPDPEDTLARFAYAGVTTVLDLSAPSPEREGWRHRIDRGRWVGPRVYGSGKPFSAPGGHPQASLRAAFPGLLVRLATARVHWEVTDAADVDRYVSRDGPRDVLKVVIDQIPREAPVVQDAALARLREAADAMGQKLLAHVGRPEDVDRALAARVDALVHIPYDGRLTEAQIDALASGRVPVVPTLSVWRAVVDVARGDVAVDRLEAELLTRRERRDVRRNVRLGGETPPRLAGWMQQAVERSHDPAINTKALVARGAPVLLGSDSPNLGLSPGAATHEEMDHLLAAGLSPMQVLAVATWHNSRFLDPDAKFGAVREGWEADLVLLDGDPRERADAIHGIKEVWIDGRRLWRFPRGQRP